MSVRPYPKGIDCVWIASDSEGHIAAFITAGVGPVPKQALSYAHLSLEYIEIQLCQLPVVSQARLLVSAKRPDDFINLAERGLFVYDWTDINRTNREALGVYEPVAVPTKPITAEALPTELAAVAKDLKLADIVFAAKDPIDVRANLNGIL